MKQRTKSLILYYLVKRILPIFFILYSPVLFGQRIKVDEVDKFTKERQIETSVSWVKRGLSCGMGFYFQSTDNYIRISIYGYGCGARVIGKGDELVLLLDNDSSITVKSIGIQDYNIEIVSGTSVQSYRHKYEIDIASIKTLSNHKVKSIRKFTSNQYEDFDISRGNQSDISDNAKVFLKAYEK